jgi:hemin uptake protein HemP
MKESDGCQRSYSDKAPKWVVYSGELFKGNREVLIVHGSQEYRLMVTKANKLLLVK